jgi:tetratricopeptide (TPR) repeat protein
MKRDSFIDRLALKRVELGYSAEQVAKMIATSVSVIRKAEAGVSLSQENARALAQAYEVAPSDINQWFQTKFRSRDAADRIKATSKIRKPIVDGEKEPLELDDEQRELRELEQQADAWRDSGEHVKAHNTYVGLYHHYRDRYEQRRDRADLFFVARALSKLGWNDRLRRRFVDARSYFTQALTLYIQLGYGPGVADAMEDLGLLGLNEGRPAEGQCWFSAAHTHLAHILEFTRDGTVKVRVQRQYVGLLTNLGIAAMDLERPIDAEAYFQRAFEQRQKLIKKQIIGEFSAIYLFENMAELASKVGDPERAIRLFWAASSVRDRVNRPKPEVNRLRHQASLNHACSLVDVHKAALIKEEASHMSLDELYRYAQLPIRAQHAKQNGRGKGIVRRAA